MQSYGRAGLMEFLISMSFLSGRSRYNVVAPLPSCCWHLLCLNRSSCSPTTRLSLFFCDTAQAGCGAVITQLETLTFTHSIFHLLASRREAKLCSVTDPNTI